MSDLMAFASWHLDAVSGSHPPHHQLGPPGLNDVARGPGMVF